MYPAQCLLASHLCQRSQLHRHFRCWSGRSQRYVLLSRACRQCRHVQALSSCVIKTVVLPRPTHRSDIFPTLPYQTSRKEVCVNRPTCHSQSQSPLRLNTCWMPFTTLHPRYCTKQRSHCQLLEPPVQCVMLYFPDYHRLIFCSVPVVMQALSIH